MSLNSTPEALFEIMAAEEGPDDSVYDSAEEDSANEQDVGTQCVVSIPAYKTT